MTDGGWPLSAAQTVLLREPKTSGTEVLKLALKELLLAGTWQLTREPVVALRRGSAAVPPQVPLALLHERLLAVAPEGGDLGEVVRSVFGEDTRIGTRLRTAAREDLAARRLLAIERRKVLGVVPRTRFTVTSSGASWDRDARERETRLRAGAAAGALVSAGGLLLLLDEDTQRLVDEVLRREDGDHVVLVSDLSAVDSAVDSGSSGGGADGGGDGGGGGGGD